MTMSKEETLLEDDIKKYLGLPPYDEIENPCVYDCIFYQYMVTKYGEQKIKEIENKVLTNP